METQVSSRKPYPTDVSDEEWAFVAPYLTFLPWLTAFWANSAWVLDGDEGRQLQQHWLHRPLQRRRGAGLFGQYGRHR